MNQPAVIWDFLTAGVTAGKTVEGQVARRQTLATKVRRNSDLESVLALESYNKVRGFKSARVFPNSSIVVATVPAEITQCLPGACRMSDDCLTNV